MSIEEYNEKVQQTEARYCSHHRPEVISLGCKICNEVLCANCPADVTVCLSGQMLHCTYNFIKSFF